MSFNQRRTRRTNRSIKPERGRTPRREDDVEKKELVDLFLLLEPPKLNIDGAECLEWREEYTDDDRWGDRLRTQPSLETEELPSNQPMVAMRLMSFLVWAFRFLSTTVCS
jgi:hypothetical protein